MTHVPTKVSRQTVELHAAIGTPQELVARLLGIRSKTLRKHYRSELDLGLAKANAKMGGHLFNKGLSGDTSAAIFWMKTRGGFNETNRLEHISPDGSMKPTTVTLVAQPLKTDEDVER